MNISETIWETTFHVDRNLPIEEYIRRKYYTNKYWKNFSHYGDYDNVDLSSFSRKELEKFISVPVLANENAISLASNPVLPSVTFSLEALFPKTKPTFCFIHQNESYNIYLDRKKIVVTELARIFVRYDNDTFKRRTVADARYILAETDGTVQLLIVLCNKLPDGMGKDAYGKTLAAIRKATMIYLSIQFALKHNSTIFYSTAINSKVKQLVVDKDKKGNLLKREAVEPECPAWGAPGRYRRYKDGRVVWVKPNSKK